MLTCDNEILTSDNEILTCDHETTICDHETTTCDDGILTCDSHLLQWSFHLWQWNSHLYDLKINITKRGVAPNEKLMESIKYFILSADKWHIQIYSINQVHPSMCCKWIWTSRVRSAEYEKINVRKILGEVKNS